MVAILKNSTVASVPDPDPRFRIGTAFDGRLDPDPHSFSMLDKDPDQHSLKKLDPNPYNVNADPKH
jgi:hypothetical protein